VAAAANEWDWGWLLEDCKLQLSLSYSPLKVKRWSPSSKSMVDLCSCPAFANVVLPATNLMIDKFQGMRCPA